MLIIQKTDIVLVGVSQLEIADLPGTFCKLLRIFGSKCNFPKLVIFVGLVTEILKLFLRYTTASPEIFREIITFNK